MRQLAKIAVLVVCIGSMAACQAQVSPEQLTATAAAQAVVQAAATATAAQAATDAVPSATPSITPTHNPFPTPVIANIYAAEQRFEGGWMFWLQPNAQIWLLSYNSAGASIWTVYDDNFVEGEAESDPQIVPPEGRFQPVRGFGKLWREKPEVRETLGWTIDIERGHTTRYEYHHGGSVDSNSTYQPAPGYHLVQGINGDTFRFNEGVFTWQIES